MRLERRLLLGSLRPGLLRLLREVAVRKLSVGVLGRHRRLVCQAQEALQGERAVRRRLRLRRGWRASRACCQKGAGGGSRLCRPVPLHDFVHFRLDEAPVDVGQEGRAARGPAAAAHVAQLVHGGPGASLHVVRGDLPLRPQGLPRSREAHGRPPAREVCEGLIPAGQAGALPRRDADPRGCFHTQQVRRERAAAQHLPPDEAHAQACIAERGEVPARRARPHGPARLPDAAGGSGGEAEGRRAAQLRGEKVGAGWYAPRPHRFDEVEDAGLHPLPRGLREGGGFGPEGRGFDVYGQPGGLQLALRLGGSSLTHAEPGGPHHRRKP
mmetsp:Transcript_130730/g.406508  ORF Transcript_130730/g.406508 Transcript_130730/m.406508 type:complete len:326 (-) Transcript_130730:507-1484(-)